MKALALSLLAALSLLGAPAWADPPRAAPAPAAVTSPDGVVNLNAANAEELERVPGIGPARAAAIVQLRARVQRFVHLEDLQRVRGIGRVSFRRMRPYLTLTGETTLLARPGRARAGDLPAP